MIRCIIVDDEQHAIDLLVSYVSKLPDVELSFATTKPIEAFQHLQKHAIDLVYLDIHMPDLDGIRLLKLLGGKSKVILTTAYPEYALEGYEHDIIDYLLKPILFDRFLKATQKALNFLSFNAAAIYPPENEKSEDDDYIFVKGDSRSRLIKIKFSDILYIESLGNYVTFNVIGSKIVTLITMNEVEEKLPGNLFIRTHKSFIAAISMIDAVEGNQLIVGAVKIPLGEKYKEGFFKKIDAKIFNSRK